jgi:hypothetical protein
MADSVVECGPSEQECRALVQRILASKDFQRASRLREFLQYVVDRKLADAPQDVTETLIGHRVFGRPPMYNTGEDSIVRTEARILRQRLNRYFAEEGSGEPLILDIPKGSYVPAFHWREQRAEAPVFVQAPVPPKRPQRTIWLAAGLCMAALLTVVVTFASWRISRASPKSAEETVPAVAARAVGSVSLESSDMRLNRSFEWAKERALGYTYTGDPVGDWYDSTAGNRYAFCMRDVSHQSSGAAVLGLAGYTHNMLRRFADSISVTRDWCGFWEINKDGFPAPIDYQDDRHFWYCLPANFDVIQACYRQFLWTGDRSYFDSVFSNFYDRTVTDYVATWDRNRDGIMESSPQSRPRGISSYHQELPKPLVGADLIAAQYRGYLAYAGIEEQKGARGSLSRRLAQEYTAKAEALRLRYNTEWWNEVQNRHYSLMLPDRKFFPGYIAETNIFALLFGLTEDGLKTEAALDSLERNRPPFDQKLSYFPEILFQYGRNDSAYEYLLEITDPNFRSRGMPEVVFAVVGATATGLVGISPDAAHGVLRTLPALPIALQWVKLRGVPVLRNEVTIYHRGVTETTITNENGPAFQWKAAFPLKTQSVPRRILVDGVPAPATIEQGINHQKMATVLVTIKPGQTRAAKLQIAKD